MVLEVFEGEKMWGILTFSENNSKRDGVRTFSMVVSSSLACYSFSLCTFLLVWTIQTGFRLIFILITTLLKPKGILTKISPSILIPL